jgi:UDP-glucose:(heptosyl)LPS alpha-1,3-glucosyltransferase
MSLRIAVVSPFLDKRHGTERCVAEQIERLAGKYGYEVHLYSQSVEDLVGIENDHCGLRSIEARGPRAAGLSGTSRAGRIIWHRVPAIPGPHLVNYLWWFGANHVWRWRDRRFRGLRCQLTYTPGINCFDADVISVHVVFAEYRRLMGDELRFRKTPLGSWPRLLHRRIYYRLVELLERRVYPRSSTLTAVSRASAEQIRRLFARDGSTNVIYYGIDPQVFNPQDRCRRREAMRRRFGLQDHDFVLLLIGNDWKNKGLPGALEALARLRDLALKMLVVGRDERAPYEILATRLGVSNCLRFLEPASDVMGFYAAADAYVGPSFNDSFALPPLEAMASGLPVIVSAQAGVSEVVSHGLDGLVLKAPANVRELAGLIERLYRDAPFRARLGGNAAETARRLSWDSNAQELDGLFQETIRLKQERAIGIHVPCAPKKDS